MKLYALRTDLNLSLYAYTNMRLNARPNTAPAMFAMSCKA